MFWCSFRKKDAVFCMYPSTYTYHKEHKYIKPRIHNRLNGIFYKSTIIFWLNEKNILFLQKNNRKMRKSNKETLYRAAFRLFLIKQFDGVSISDIEEESGMTRGAVFYYANTKLDLFKKVVEYYILDTQDVNNKVSYTSESTLIDYINMYVNGIENTMQRLFENMQMPSRENACRAYISTLLQVCTLFPDIKERYLLNLHNDISRWVSVINSAVDNGEVVEGIDVLSIAKQFVCIFYGLSVVDSMSHGLNIPQLREQMYTLYNIIKKV